MDIREARRYLAKLYDEGDRFEVAYIHPGPSGNGTSKVARVTRTYTAETLDTILNEMERGEANGYNVYVSALPVGRQEGLAFDRIWVDQDDPTAIWPWGSDPESPSWPKPTTLVKTSEEGGGFRWQAIWKLSEELTHDEARRMMKQLAALIGADGSVHDARRVLRVPGILNAKRGQTARLMETNDGLTPPEAFTLPTTSGSPLEKLMSMEVNDPKTVLGEWLRGTSEGDRSRKAYVAARFLRACDVDWGDAAGILKLGAVRCNPPMEDHELEHALNSAYHRGDA